MKTFVKFFNNYIIEISPTRKDLSFDEYTVDDLDFFNNYRFYTATQEKTLTLRPEYKKLEDREYLVHIFDDGSITLLKPFIEHVSATFVKFNSAEEENEVRLHLDHYYDFDNETKTFVVNEEKLALYQREFHVVEFRNYRYEVFKKWDIIKTNSLIGLADPITQEEKDWYLSMLSFTDEIDNNSTPDTWPVIPLRFI